MAVRVHPFPFRTRQLSSLALKILGWKRPGKISRCQHKKTSSLMAGCFFARIGYISLNRRRKRYQRQYFANVAPIISKKTSPMTSRRFCIFFLLPRREIAFLLPLVITCKAEFFISISFFVSMVRADIFSMPNFPRIMRVSFTIRGDLYLEKRKQPTPVDMTEPIATYI